MTKTFNESVVLAAHGIIQEAVEQYNPSHVFGLFSGGHDSLCACHIASQHPRFDGCIHINTGIGVKETREFVRGICQQYGWPLKEYHPPDSFEDIVTEHGFPGPGQHATMYIRLKERALRQIMREHGKRSRKILFVTGVRRQESVRRMGTINFSGGFGVEIPYHLQFAWGREGTAETFSRHAQMFYY